ncbi:hypothetical protein ACS0TY_029744 [Phlomoides rotata]
MNSWIEHPQYKAFFLEKWNNYCIEGWAAFRLKEKLKLFKSDLRGWNKVIFGDIDYNIDTKKEEIEILDQIDDQWKEKFLAQKAKARWLREGDVNSSYFHVWINRNRKSNTIEGLLINDRWINSVKGVKKWIHEHFENHFKAPHSTSNLIPRITSWHHTLENLGLGKSGGKNPSEVGEVERQKIVVWRPNYFDTIRTLCHSNLLSFVQPYPKISDQRTHIYSVRYPLGVVRREARLHGSNGKSYAMKNQMGARDKGFMAF